MEAPKNMLFMVVTEETSQPEMSPSKEEAPSNMLLVLLTFDRFGESVALYAMLDVLENALNMVFHSVPPHCSIDLSWCAFAISSERLMLRRPPPSTVTV